MPIYDMQCPEGDGYYSDIICRIDDRHQQKCPECGVFLSIVPAPVMTVGPLPSKSAYTFSQIGRKFETNAELRQYRRENPEVRFQGKQEFQRHKDVVREKCETTARRQGFRDLEAKQTALKKGATSLR